MPIILRVMLIVGSLVTGVYIRGKLRKSQMQIEDVIFWLFFAAALVFMSVFPELIVWFAELIGVDSAVNFVFLCVIFLMLIRCFSLSVKVSTLEVKLKELTERLAVKEALIHEEGKEDT
ncbi:MAG: DUF2304 domain-containing protein [Lachnospiraceae bacterium]|nr:DUF2304 domain-containing protein [Lachnospiraceae bacterium]